MSLALSPILSIVCYYFIIYVHEAITKPNVRNVNDWAERYNTSAILLILAAVHHHSFLLRRHFQ
jgi:hypothetical protein